MCFSQGGIFQLYKHPVSHVCKVCMTSLRTHGFLFYPVDYNSIYLFILLWCLNCPRFGLWECFQDGFCVLLQVCHFLSTLLLSRKAKQSQHMFHFLCPRSGITPSSREPWFLLAQVQSLLSGLTADGAGEYMKLCTGVDMCASTSVFASLAFSLHCTTSNYNLMPQG